MIMCFCNVMPDSKREAVDFLLKAAGYLEFCIRDVLSQMPPEIKYVYCFPLMKIII